MKRPILLLIIVLVTSSISICQSYTWRGSVYASDQREALVGANIFAKSDRIGAVTDLKGQFSLAISKWPIQIEISYLGYQSQIITAASPEDLPVRIVLEPSTTLMTEVVIAAESRPEAVTRRRRSVVDFVLFDDYLLYVESLARRGKYALVLTTMDGVELDRMSVSDFPLYESLFISCQDVPYVLAEHVAYELLVDDDQLHIAFESSRQDFDQYVVPCQAKTSRYLYHGIYTFAKEVVSIQQVDLSTGKYQLFAEVYDEESLEAAVRSLQLMQMYSRFAQHSSDPYYSERLKMESKHRNLFQSEVQYDLFAVGDTILVMDYEQHHISYYDQDRQHLVDVPIYYNQEKDWVGSVLQDRVTSALYVLIKDNGHLVVYRLDHQQGTLQYVMHTEIDYLDKMQMHDGHLWYTTSRLVGPPGKLLHKWRLP